MPTPTPTPRSHTSNGAWSAETDPTSVPTGVEAEQESTAGAAPDELQAPLSDPDTMETAAGIGAEVAPESGAIETDGDELTRR